jgi:hypothetical protein
LREEHRLRVFENRVLRKIFGPIMDEVTGEWRRLHNEELNDLYSSPNTIWVIKSRRRNGTCVGKEYIRFLWGIWGKETIWKT